MWATGFVVARLSAPHADPLSFLAIRFPIAGLLFAAIALALGAPWPGRRAALHASVAGAFLHGGYLGPVYWAVAHGMPAGVSALIVGLQPLMTAVLAAWLVKEAISLRHWVGLAVGILGVALVVWPKLQMGLHRRHHAADHRRQCLWGAVDCLRHGLSEAICHGAEPRLGRRLAICRRQPRGPGLCADDGGFPLRRQFQCLVRARLVGAGAVPWGHHAADAADPPWRRGAGFEPDLPGARRFGADGLWPVRRDPESRCRSPAWRSVPAPC